MAAGTVHVTRDGPVVTLTIDNPSSRNALTQDMRASMLDAVRDASTDPALRVVLLRSVGGRVFASGADIREFDGLSKQALDRLESDAEQLYDAFERCPAPTVAVLDGSVLGGGLLLAAACDLRVCTPDARFGIPSARSLGNCLGEHDYQRLAALVGPPRVKQLLVLAEVVDAATALAWGLVTHVVEREDLDGAIEDLAGRLAGHAPLSMWAAKEAMRRIASGEPVGRDIMERVLTSHDFSEGVAAFQDKRAPRWRNA